jgi:two-component system C4-dicarboxylate transport sensor histidine kinase DctB
MDAPWVVRSGWRIRPADVGWCIANTPPSNRDLLLLVAANRAAAFGVAARWVLHDLRSPAQSLTLIADLMADPDTEVEEILRDSCGHLARSLDLLTRIVHPSPPAEPGPISVREPIGFIADLHRAGRTHAHLDLELAPSLPAALGVERDLEHALLNLVLNATEALQPKEGGAIRITAKVEADRIAIVVADNGPGVPPDLTGQLFRSPVASGTRSHPGGLGLLVAHQLVSASGGTLAYAPDSERGARFVITLPLWRREPAHPAAR